MTTRKYNRVYVPYRGRRLRLHHGRSGMGILFAGLMFGYRPAIFLGAVLMLDDIADAPWSFDDDKTPWLYPRKFGIVRLFIKDVQAQD